MNNLNMLVLLFCSVTCISSVFCATQDSAVRSLVYTDIDVNSFDKCARLMNGTNQIGCQSALSGDVGVLFHVNQSDDISRVLAGKYSPYIVIIHADYFNHDNVKLYQSSGKVTGIIVYSSEYYTGKSGGWSPELKCPRYEYGLYNTTYGSQYAKCDNNPWNAEGDGLTEADINFPVFIIKNDTSAQMLINCHDEHNLDNEYPLCSAQMKSRMDGAQSTETCIRRNELQNNLSPAQYCDLMGGHTILGTLQVTNSSAENSKPIILVTATLDSRSFEMTSFSPGANSVTGFVALLAVAQALGNLTEAVKENLTHDVKFVLFDGEVFDSMGSLRMVYDMSKNAFPFAEKSDKWQPERFDLSRVEYIIEIGQVGLIQDTATTHFDPLSARNQATSAGIQAIMKALNDSTAASSIKFSTQSKGIGLVPSSLQSILRERNVSGVVITDFDKSYKNQYYFSRYDTAEQLGITLNGNTTENDTLPLIKPFTEKIIKLSSIVAKAVYQLATNGTETLAETTIDEPLFSRVLYCYYFNASCTLVRSLLDSNVKKYQFHFNQYVGVYNPNVMRNSAYLARNLLAFFLGNVKNVNTTDECKSDYEQDEIFQYLAFSRPPIFSCLSSTVYDMDGRSPSAIISGYDYKSGRYGAWSESRWQTSAFHLSIFLTQDSVSQGMILLSGLLMLTSSFAIVYIIHKKSEILFDGTEML